jgi:hypothetical protein
MDGMVRSMDRTEELQKFIKLTGDRAKLDAKANETYIVYKAVKDQIVKEHSNVDVILVPEQDLPHA